MSHPYRESSSSSEETETIQLKEVLDIELSDCLIHEIKTRNNDFLPALEENDSEAAWNIRQDLFSRIEKYAPEKIDRLITELDDFKKSNSNKPNKERDETMRGRLHKELESQLQNDLYSLLQLAENIGRLNSNQAKKMKRELAERAQTIDLLYSHLQHMPDLNNIVRPLQPSEQARPINAVQRIERTLSKLSGESKTTTPKRTATQEDVDFLLTLEDEINIHPLIGRLLLFTDSPTLLEIKRRLAERIKSNDKISPKDKSICLARLLG